MIVRKIDTKDPHAVQQFIDLPFSLYRDNPYWVPAFDSEMRLVLDRGKHPFYQHSTADFFLALSEGQPLGRIAVLHNKNYSAHHKKKIGFFYYFETIQDAQVGHALLDAAVEWCRQQELDLLMGPRGFLRSNSVGLLVEGFEYMPALGISYNHPYYADYVNAHGFTKETDHFSGLIFADHKFPERLFELAEKVKQKQSFWVKTFKSTSEMKKWIPYVDEVHSAAFFNNYGYYPSTPAEFELLANNIIQIADPKMIKLIMKGDEVAGFAIAYPDISKAVQRTHGKMLPFGWIDLLAEKRRTKVVDLNGIGILPKYQGFGANALVYAELIKTMYDAKMERGELVQVDERNFKSKSDMETLGVQWCKTHRSYRLELQK